jgi:4,5-dihydroxyphthalate decarboxylase
MLSFTFAISSYDHVREVVDGRVPIEGADPLFVRLPIPEMFRRFVLHGDWDVSEMSFVQYGTMRANGEDRIVGIPVFPSRIYRHTSIFVRSDRIKEPADLAGSRIGIPGWANSAGVWARGLLADMHGIQPADVTWYQAGIDRPGRPEVVKARYLADDVRVIPVPDRCLEEMLWAGDLEAIIVPNPPPSIETSAITGGLVRYPYDDLAAAEQEYREKTGCLPIMHVVGINRDLYEQDPGIVARIYTALDTARQRYFERLADPKVSWAPVPWVGSHLRSLGTDPWPYGVVPNLPTLRTYLRYLRTQGLIGCDIEGREIEPEALFPEWGKS